ncbi:MAG: NAD(P)H-dependent oxidoreductase [Campylobacterales bacterium]|nr:NAD(P)H-dependent oxidoreductase [Campylobacterales bacterium]
MDKRHIIMKAFKFRHACKLFDKDKKISKCDMQTILEAGRLSPSSFGMEPWKFLVIQNSELKQMLQPVCWNQVQITTCSDLVIILAKKIPLDATSEYVKNSFARKELSKEMFDAYMTKYSNYISTKDINWCMKQCYIALANMMSVAAFLNIDSCPIEGFEKEKVEEILNIDTNIFEVAVIITFGYRVNNQPTQHRLSSQEVITYL